MHYKENQLPEHIKAKMPLRGNTDIYTGVDNVVRVPKLMRVYMFAFNTSMDTSEWAQVGDKGDYLEYPGAEDEIIYQRIIPAGTYTFSNLGAMYLFSDDMGSILNFYHTLLR